MSKGMVKISGRKFLDLLSSSDGREELTDATGDFIRTVLREEGIARKIIPFKKADPDKMQVRTDSDELYDLVEIEPGAGAVLSNFTAQAPAKYVTNQKAELTFSQIKGTTVEKTVEELMAVGYDMFKVIKNYTALEIQAKEDQGYINALYHSAYSVQKETGTKKIVQDATLGAKLSKDHFISLKNTLDTDRLLATRMVTAQAFFNDIIAWSAGDVGFNAVEGMAFDKTLREKTKNLYTLESITSIKTELFRRKEVVTGKDALTIENKTTATTTTVSVTEDIDEVIGVYTDAAMQSTNYYTGGSFTGKDITLGTAVSAANTTVYVQYREKLAAPITRVWRQFYTLTDNDFLGAARELIPVQFWTEKKENMVRMGSFETIGMVIANARAVGLMELLEEQY